MGKFWLLGGIFLASPGFSTKVWGKGGQYKPSGENKGTSKGTFCWEGWYKGIILGDDSFGHYFALRYLIVTSFFN